MMNTVGFKHLLDATIDVIAVYYASPILRLEADIAGSATSYGISPYLNRFGIDSFFAQYT
jgi:hypothetical protein